MNDEQAIRDLFTGWVEANQKQDLEGVLAEHDPNIVMFDVPPPYNGVRGIDEYRKSWPPFFEWINQGAQFQLLELDVVAGAEVAFAYALLRCGTQAEFDANPDNRLRISVGLRKSEDRWAVVHEHHSFPMVDRPFLRLRDRLHPRHVRRRGRRAQAGLSDVAAAVAVHVERLRLGAHL